MSNIKWHFSGNTLRKMDGTVLLDSMPSGVYDLTSSMVGPYLSKISDTFEFPFKIYGVDDFFINHAITSFKESEKNLGILLNGAKGGGKTVTAKMLANASNLPVVMVTASNIDLLSYFSDVSQPICFFFDEFEKIVNHDNKQAIAPLLSFVDGAVTSTKHLMLFTSNDTRISEYFIDRPGRIRYNKEYNSLSKEVIKEILDDLLIYPKYRQDILDWVLYFEVLTIDMLISIIKEVNIHNVSPKVFKDFFNVDNEKTFATIALKIFDEDSQNYLTWNSKTVTRHVPEKFIELVEEGDIDFSLTAFGDFKENHSLNLISGSYKESDFYLNCEPILSNSPDYEEGKHKVILSFYGGIKHQVNFIKNENHGGILYPDQEYVAELVFTRSAKYNNSYF